MVGGVDAESREMASALFARLTSRVIPVSSLEAAEAVKLVNNCHTDLIYSFGNEVALFAERLALDPLELIRAANVDYPRPDLARPGFVGGGCLSKDPYILIASSIAAGYEPWLVARARGLNEYLPLHVARRFVELIRETRGAVAGGRVLLLGFAYKGWPPTDDMRGAAVLPILDVLRTGSEEEKSAALRKLQQSIGTNSVRDGISTLKKLLIDFLDHTTIGPNRQEESLVLSLKEQILVKDVNSMVTHNIFFQKGFEKNGGLDALKYIAIEDASTSREAICKLPVTLTFQPMYYYAADDQPEIFSMKYEMEGMQALPIFLAPIDNSSPDRYKEKYQKVNRVVFYYRHRPAVRYDSEQAFVYRFTYTLLAYLFLKVLADSIAPDDPRKLFFPIVCLHALEKVADESNKKLDDEDFVHALSKVLTHMLAEDYTANSQGFHLSTVRQEGMGRYKLDSALYSLYSALPRAFQLSKTSREDLTNSPARYQLDKLAIVIVSSRRCDVNKNNPEAYQSSVYGEIVGIERLANATVRVGTLSTFSCNQSSQEMYRSKSVMVGDTGTFCMLRRHLIAVHYIFLMLVMKKNSSL